MAGGTELKESSREAKKKAQIGKIFMKEEFRKKAKQISVILKKPEESRSSEEQLVLDKSPDVVALVLDRIGKQNKTKERATEFEDSTEVLAEKCSKLAAALRDAKHVVFYTGAGISTAASIPDYRGPNGVWTLLQKGKSLECHDLSQAEPTLTHMAVYELHGRGMVQYVVSQNCDGLHLRSGLPRTAISEVHGNMYLEMCKQCRPMTECFRLFDVTERTMLHRHKTGRRCPVCGSELTDTIVHFGERGTNKVPQHWDRAGRNVDKADVVVCIGSSLKVLKRYPCLWSKHKAASQRPRLYIINLQWTPKDNDATLKINGRCDEVMRQTMEHLQLDIPEYKRSQDPLFTLATPLKEDELDSTSRPQLELNPDVTRSIKTDPSASSSSTDSKLPPEVKSSQSDDEEEELMKNDEFQDEKEPNEDGDNKQLANELSAFKRPSNPGWFGKGYRKSQPKKRRRKSQ